MPFQESWDEDVPIGSVTPANTIDDIFIALKVALGERMAQAIVGFQNDAVEPKVPKIPHGTHENRPEEALGAGHMYISLDEGIISIGKANGEWEEVQIKSENGGPGVGVTGQSMVQYNQATSNETPPTISHYDILRRIIISGEARSGSIPYMATSHSGITVTIPDFRANHFSGQWAGHWPSLSRFIARQVTRGDGSDYEGGWVVRLAQMGYDEENDIQTIQAAIGRIVFVDDPPPDRVAIWPLDTNSIVRFSAEIIYRNIP